MLHAITRGTGEPTLILMHFLGGSAREWDEVVEELGSSLQTVAVDLPGFGDSAAISGFTVQQMADAVEDLLRSIAPRRFVLVGHSMSGKVAMVLARRFADRPSDVLARALQGLLLVAPSPPGPEPMAEEKRTQMLANLGTSKEGDRQRAEAFITKGGERDIPEPVVRRAADEVLKMSRAAWVAWLEHGSKEDWAGRVGVLDLPVTIVVGEQDRSLGEEQQRHATMPHLANARLHVLPHCSHQIPMEKPRELTRLLRAYLATLPDVR